MGQNVELVGTARVPRGCLRSVEDIAAMCLKSRDDICDRGSWHRLGDRACREPQQGENYGLHISRRSQRAMSCLNLVQTRHGTLATPADMKTVVLALLGL